MSGDKEHSNDPLELLGITKEDLQSRVVTRICDRLLEQEWFYDEDGEPDHGRGPSQLMTQLKKKIQLAVDAKIEALAKEHVLGDVKGFIDNLTLQETTKWGEPKGGPVSFIEYLVSRANAYLEEQVDYQGKSKAEDRDSYNWRGTQTRLTSIVHAHLHFSIEQAMKAAVGEANKQLAGLLAETAKRKLAEIAVTLKVDTGVKS